MLVLVCIAQTTTTAPAKKHKQQWQQQLQRRQATVGIAAGYQQIFFLQGWAQLPAGSFPSPGSSQTNESGKVTN